MATIAKTVPAIETNYNLKERTMFRRAVEAVIWGMPTVNFDRMLKAAIDNGGKTNQMIYWSRPISKEFE